MQRKTIAAAAFALFAFIGQANAQSGSVIVLPSGCGTGAQQSGSLGYLTVDTTLKLCVNATVNASISPFQPSASGSRGTPVTVTTSDSSGTLPTGATVVVTNAGANPMYCNVAGVAATVADQLITSSGGWFVFTPQSGQTTLHCIATGGSTTANTVGGSGLPNGTGGGSGGSGGGAVTVADGADVTQGAIADAAATAGSTGTVSAKLRLMTTQLNGASTAANQTSQITQETATAAALGTTTDAVGATPSSGSAATLIALAKAINNNVAAAIPAGANLIGKVGIDQTTDGTTNGVRMTNAYPSGATPITASATGTTAATTATLAGAVAKTTYICGYSIRANATATTTVTNTLTGVITGTLSSIMWVPANTAGLGVDEQIFSPCIPASTTNTAIAAVSGAPGTGGLVSSKAWGYQQ